MKSVQIVEFDPHHLQVMDIRDHELSGTFKLADVYERVLKVKESSLVAGTFIHDGRVICCAGFSQIWPGVLEGWMIPSAWVKTAPVFFAKYLKRYIEATAKTFNCHRFQTTSIDDDFHFRWMTWLGFEKEGTMRQYTHDKKNYCIYARLFTWPTR